MGRLTGVLVIVPFLAWSLYRVIRALRTGVFESFDGSARDVQPEAFWLGVASQVLQASMFLSMIVGVLLGLRTMLLLWVGGALFVAYVLFTIGIGIYMARAHHER